MELSEEIKVYLDENEYKKIVNDTEALSSEELKLLLISGKMKLKT